METTVNQRVALLKKQLDLSDVEFCVRAKISTGTLHRINKGEVISSKVITAICTAYNVNREWLLNGTGSTYAEAKEIEAANPWKEVALIELQSKNTFLEKEVERLHSIIAYFTSNVQQKAANFLKAPKEAAVIELYPALQETGS